MGLPLQLRRHPACPTRPNAPSEALLTPLAHSGVIFRAHSQPAAPAFAIYKSAAKARLNVDLRRYLPSSQHQLSFGHTFSCTLFHQVRCGKLLFVSSHSSHRLRLLLIPVCLSNLCLRLTPSTLWLVLLSCSRAAHPGEDFAPSCPVVPRLALAVC